MLSDTILNRLRAIPRKSYEYYWYVTQQRLDIVALCYCLKMLRDSEAAGEGFVQFFDSHKTLPAYGGYPDDFNYRATVNASYFGLMLPKTSSREAYRATSITPVFDEITLLCGGDYADRASYQSVVNRQIEYFSYNENGFQIYPTMFLFKILLMIGDATGNYEISGKEFQLFVATAKKWNEYMAVAQAILRYREDAVYHSDCDAALGLLDSRFDSMVANHTYIEKVGSRLRLRPNCVNDARKAVAEREISGEIDVIDQRRFFSPPTDPAVKPRARQLIIFGAPGTGKSHKIKHELGVSEAASTRTTFHPDSDYASFVGCYKPRKVDGELTYEFTAQAFTRAYVEAWKRIDDAVAAGFGEPAVYTLVIEEINRGNCAQIFGDLFQLLDRDATGYSEYPIEPDADLADYLGRELSGCTNIPKDIREGRRMQLPRNLHIIATMNTSDQSLFPIDSAFKRRWEWEYLPIADLGLNHRVHLGDIEFGWWDFLTAVNVDIAARTGSEDKMLGYWFVKPSGTDGVIDGDLFVSKVLFYLWNDIYKDYIHEDTFFSPAPADDGSRPVASFARFFGKDGIDTASVITLVRNIFDAAGLTGRITTIVANAAAD